MPGIVLKTPTGERVELDGLISQTVQDVLAGEGMLEFVRDNIAKALEPLEKSQSDFRSDLLTSINKGFEKQQAGTDTKGLLIGRVMRALAACRMDPIRAAAYAQKEWRDERVAKALSSSENVAGGFLLREEVGDLIELLRPASVVRSMGPIIVPMEGGTIRMPKHTAGASGGWIGENTNIPMTQPGFGSVSLNAKKYASLVPVSNDLLRRASPQADMLVRDDLVADIATSTDLGFIRGVGTDAMPKGLRYQATSSGIVVRSGNGNATLAEITGDLVGMIQRMGDNNVRMIRMGWLTEWRTWARLMSIRDGNGNLAFAAELSRGTLWGYPLKVTSNIPRGLTGGGGGSNETELYLVDFADVLIGETTGILIDTSGEAAYHNGSAVVAAFSQDQTVIRAIVEVDLAVRHPESVQVLVGVDWAPADTGA